MLGDANISYFVLYVLGACTEPYRREARWRTAPKGWAAHFHVLAQGQEHPETL